MPTAPDPILHHERLIGGGAEPAAWILILPGIFGAGRNWRSVAKRLVTVRPDWGVVLVDLRQHGSSMGFPPPHTLEAAARDVAAMVAYEGLAARAVLGHSFGGKVAMIYAQGGGIELEQLWIIDSTPGARRPLGSAWDMLGVLRRVCGPFANREQAVKALRAEGLNVHLAQWMATNLSRSQVGDYRWRIDPDEMEALLSSFFATDAWEVVEASPPRLQVHVVKATESSVLDEMAWARIEAAALKTGRVRAHRVPSGHWLNADNPEALVALLALSLGRG